MVEALRADLRDSWRSLRARPSYAAVVIATVAIVTGAAAAVVAVINATMIRPLPYPDAGRLARIYLMPPGTSRFEQRNPLNPRALVRMREGLRQVETVEGFWFRDRALGGEGDPENVPAAIATTGALPLLGGTLIGRSWTDDEDRANARVVVLSHVLWQRRFGGDPSILGRRLLIDREPYEVIGVMPPEFHPVFFRAELFLPFNLAGQSLDNGSTFIVSVARLRPDATVRSLDREVQAFMSSLVNEAPNQFRGWRGGATTLREAQFGRQQPALLMLAFAVAALALLAAANLANVTLAQTVSRRTEWALRAALGASRARLVRLQAIESVALALAGAGAGLLLGRSMLPALLALDPLTARVLGEVDVDWRVQIATAGMALAVALVSGVMPALRTTSASAAESLAEGGRRSVGGRGGDRIRLTLVAIEAAVSVVLLVCGGMLLASFVRDTAIRPGFDATNVLGAQMRLSQSAYPTEAARNSFVAAVLDRLRTLPGVSAAASTTNLFIPGSSLVTLLHIEGRPTADGQPHTVQFRRVSPGYFRTLAIPLEAGRDFDGRDAAAAPPVAIVSRSFADRYWPGENPIGQQIRRNAAKFTQTVVGVVGDVSDVGLSQPPEPTLYLPYTQNNPVAAPVSLVVRTSGDPLALAPAVRAAVLGLDPAQPVDNMLTLEQYLSDSLGTQRFRSTLLLTLALIGVALAAIGTYGVTARFVRERTREIGVRLALGASRSSVWMLVVGRAMRAVAAGMVTGLAVAAFASTAMLSLLPNLDRADWPASIAAVVVLLLFGLTAAALPALRAINVPPGVAIRD